MELEGILRDAQGQSGGVLGHGREVVGCGSGVSHAFFRCECEAAPGLELKLLSLRKMARALGVGGALALVPMLALAVVHSTADGTSNTAAPPNDPGWAHMALLHDLTGVYIGGGWILTANHVPDRDAVIGGQVYPFVPGSRVVFETSPGVNADLAVYRIQGDPGLPYLMLGATPPAVGEPVVMIGHGWNREATTTQWNASFVEVPPGAPAHEGYKRGVAQALRWGRNVVEGTGIAVNISGIISTSLFTRFDASGGGLQPDEAQAVVGDSGGALFYERGGAGSGNWELAGILYTVATFSGQPADTAVFGTVTYAVEVAAYAADIEAVTAPVVPALPLLGFVFAALGIAGAASRFFRR